MSSESCMEVMLFVLSSAATQSVMECFFCSANDNPDHDRGVVLGCRPALLIAKPSLSSAGELCQGSLLVVYDSSVALGTVGYLLAYQ